MTTIIASKTFNKANTYNATSDTITDGNSVLCLDHLSDILIEDCIIDGEDCEWGLKLSNCTNITIRNCIIQGGTERATDIVRGNNITFTNCVWKRNTKHSKYSLSKTTDIGIKAGVNGVSFNSCYINDILLGDWSCYDAYQDTPTQNITLTDTQGNPSIRIWNGKNIVYVDGQVRLNKWPTVMKAVYWQYNKWFGDTRRLP